MRRRIVADGTSVLAALLVVVSARAATSAPREDVLERYPVCEASAALEVPCAGDARGACVWVADDEQDAELFAYDVEEGGRLVPREAWRIALRGARVDDVEALARDGEDVLVLGSHGRDSTCRPRPGRAAVARVAVDDSAVSPLASGARWQERLARCEGELIEPSSDAAGGELRRAVCAAISAAERAADEAASGGRPCPGDAFNVEGAAAVPGNGGPRVWLGLRGPLVGDDRAILLRLVPGIVREGNVAFDGVAAVDLGGRGIRELSFADGFVWGIAGSVEDGARPSRLWRMPASLLRDGAVVAEVETLSDALPPTAEALVVQPGKRRAIVLVDGDTSKRKTRCAEPARQMVVPLPLP
ncbi:MAG: DUF3616 domain-containing protein [Thermodesulfobacteriota bacterium]